MYEYLLIVLLGVLAALLTGIVLFRLWPRTGRLGINTRTVHCPECGLKAPLVRKPHNLRQVLWGGWTCARCGCEFDKYGTLSGN